MTQANVLRLEAKADPRALTDIEALASLFELVAPPDRAWTAARTLTETFSGVANVLRAPQANLRAMDGVGMEVAELVARLHNIVARVARERMFSADLENNPEAIIAYCSEAMAGRRANGFLPVFARHGQFVGMDEAIYGTIGSVAIYPREVVKAALACDATTIIPVFGRSYGKLDLTSGETQVVDRLEDAASALELSVNDPVVIISGDGSL